MTNEEFELILEEAFIAGYDDACNHIANEAFEELHEKRRNMKVQSIRERKKIIRQLIEQIKLQVVDDEGKLKSIEVISNNINNHPYFLMGAGYFAVKDILQRINDGNWGLVMAFEAVTCVVGYYAAKRKLKEFYHKYIGEDFPEGDDDANNDKRE